MTNKKHFLPGTPVNFHDQMYFVKSAVSDQMTLIVDEHGNNPQLVNIDELQPYKGSGDIEKDLALIPDEDWDKAQKRFHIIRPLLNLPDRTRSDVEGVAKANSITAMTIYRWIKAYEKSETVSALVDTPKSGGKGKSRLEPEVEATITNAINDFYLQKKKPSITKIINEVSFKCHELGLNKPHPNTIRNRISSICERDALIKRQGYKAYKDKYSPIKGKHPDTNWPMGVIQIDHTPANVILVDDVERQPVGRPWLTLAIDIYSRTVAGYYLSFDPPSSISVSMCLLQAVLPKDSVLSEFEIEGEWINQGLPKTIQVDNAKEFRSKAMENSAKNYSIEINWRPVGKPEFGGHIERLLGTFSNRFNDLDGTTKSNTKDRGKYESEKQSTMTLVEFQKWFVLQILKYHEERHSELRMAPITKLKHALLGDGDIPGQGLPPLPFDFSRFKLDLLPYEERTIQPYGVIIDHIHYFHDVLRPWINATCEDNKKIKKKFIFRRDPRDISAIFFWDPKHKHYIRIPYRDMSHPRMSIWEHRAARKQAEEKYGAVNEERIFNAYAQMRHIEETAKHQTKKTRRASQRRKSWVENSTTIVNSFPEPSKLDNDINWDEPLVPFGEIEEFDG